ncbi:hypothetical protein DY000_02031693 [Brassica cretica]|uniref:Adenosine diphosphatase n=1 Tax=Brassica cretica TaxID=69181 RepID=A0ABQ7DRR0_BRACR|nr:hypothetical protein DY000_02031693 [Brassica cretica]
MANSCKIGSDGRRPTKLKAAYVISPQPTFYYFKDYGEFVKPALVSFISANKLYLVSVFTRIFECAIKKHLIFNLYMWMWITRIMGSQLLTTLVCLAMVLKRRLPKADKRKVEYEKTRNSVCPESFTSRGGEKRKVPVLLKIDGGSGSIMFMFRFLVFFVT